MPLSECAWASTWQRRKTTVFIAHAHILLVGFVVSFVYGLIHKLWVVADSRAAATVQFYLHQLSALVMGVGLMLFYGGLFQETLDPILAVSAFGVLGAAALMVYLSSGTRLLR